MGGTVGIFKEEVYRVAHPEGGKQKKGGLLDVPTCSAQVVKTLPLEEP